LIVTIRKDGLTAWKDKFFLKYLKINKTQKMGKHLGKHLCNAPYTGLQNEQIHCREGSDDIDATLWLDFTKENTDNLPYERKEKGVLQYTIEYNGSLTINAFQVRFCPYCGYEAKKWK